MKKLVTFALFAALAFAQRANLSVVSFIPVGGENRITEAMSSYTFQGVMLNTGVPTSSQWSAHGVSHDPNVVCQLCYLTFGPGVGTNEQRTSTNTFTMYVLDRTQLYSLPTFTFEGR